MWSLSVTDPSNGWNSIMVSNPCNPNWTYEGCAYDAVRMYVTYGATSNLWGGAFIAQNTSAPGTWSGGCPMNVTWSITGTPPSASLLSGIAMYAQATSATGLTLPAAAVACGFAGFDWQQEITNLPCGIHVFPAAPSNVLQNICPNGTLKAPPNLSDPPKGGYNILNQDNTWTYNYLSGNFPFYYLWTTELNVEDFPSSALCITPKGTPCTPPVSMDDKVLSFFDDPDGDLPGKAASSNPPADSFIGFTTTLVGVDQNGNPVSPPISRWTWNTTYNGTNGGVHRVATDFSSDPPDPGSGTGGITITSINGVQLPAVVSPSQVATTASGLAYSRVSQTFNGTVTLSNVGGSAVSGPLQIVFFGMPVGVTLVNATGNLSGTPYLTIPALAGLAPGQSTTVSVQFKNPANATINLAPVIYSGSIN